MAELTSGSSWNRPPEMLSTPSCNNSQELLHPWEADPTGHETPVSNNPFKKHLKCHMLTLPKVHHLCYRLF